MREEERRRAERAEERREWARFSRELAKETSSGHEYRGAFIAAQKPRCVRSAFIAGMKIEKWYGNIYCHPYCMVLGTVSKEKAGTVFEVGTPHFPRQHSVFVGTEIEVV